MSHPAPQGTRSTGEGRGGWETGGCPCGASQPPAHRDRPYTRAAEGWSEVARPSHPSSPRPRPWCCTPCFPPGPKECWPGVWPMDRLGGWAGSPSPLSKGQEVSTESKFRGACDQFEGEPGTQRSLGGSGVGRTQVSHPTAKDVAHDNRPPRKQGAPRIGVGRWRPVPSPGTCGSRAPAWGRLETPSTRAALPALAAGRRRPAGTHPGTPCPDPAVLSPVPDFRTSSFLPQGKAHRVHLLRIANNKASQAGQVESGIPEPREEGRRFPRQSLALHTLTTLHRVEGRRPCSQAQPHCPSPGAAPQMACCHRLLAARPWGHHPG